MRNIAAVCVRYKAAAMVGTSRRSEGRLHAVSDRSLVEGEDAFGRAVEQLIARREDLGVKRRVRDEESCRDQFVLVADDDGAVGEGHHVEVEVVPEQIRGGGGRVEAARVGDVGVPTSQGAIGCEDRKKVEPMRWR